MREVKAMHDPLGQVERVSHVLKQADKRAVLIKRKQRVESDVEGLGSASKLSARYKNEAKLGENEDAKPKPPSTKHTLLRNSHDQPRSSFDLSTQADGTNSRLNPNNANDVVVTVSE